jgi:selenocysteine lyase/cysteine desulfurase
MEGGSGSNSASPEMPDFLPDRLEAGTHNMPGIAGLSAGLSFIMSKGTDRIFNYEQKLISLMNEEMRKINGVEVYSEDRERAETAQSGMVSFNFKNIPPERGAELLSRKGVAVRAGLHCSPLSHKSAGTFPEGTIRASVSAFTTEREIYEFTGIVKIIASS